MSGGISIGFSWPTIVKESTPGQPDGIIQVPITVGGVSNVSQNQWVAALVALQALFGALNAFHTHAAITEQAKHTAAAVHGLLPEQAAPAPQPFDLTALQFGNPRPEPAPVEVSPAPVEVPVEVKPPEPVAQADGDPGVLHIVKKDVGFPIDLTQKKVIELSPAPADHSAHEEHFEEVDRIDG